MKPGSKTEHELQVPDGIGASEDRNQQPADWNQQSADRNQQSADWNQQSADRNQQPADRKGPGSQPHVVACCCSRNTHRDEPEKKALINRCSRVEGQIRGISGMLEKDLYCDDILNQVAAVRSALDSISRLILERHMKSCLIDRIQAGDLEVVDELLGTLQKMMK